MQDLWISIKAFVSTDTARWYETMPFIFGVLLTVFDIIVRLLRGRRPLITAIRLSYMFSEGITVCIILIYFFALIFDHKLAVHIADKDSEALIVAMFIAFATITTHIFEGWFSADEDQSAPT